MATISSAAIASTAATTLNLNPTTARPRFTSLSSSNSLFFSNNNRASLSLVSARTRRPSPKKNGGLSCTCLFGLGVPELVVIAGVVALVFGPKKLPEVGRSIGKTVKSFQQAAKEFESELKKDGESSTEPPAEKVATLGEEEKQEAKVSSNSESA